MKKLSLLLAIVCALISPSFAQTSSNNTSEDINKPAVTYAVHISSIVPYELFLDDILIDWNYTNNTNKTTELNPYLLKNGKAELRIRYFPLTINQNKILEPRDIIFNKDIQFDIYFAKLNKDTTSQLGYSNEIDYGSAKLTVTPPPHDVPFWDNTWELDITDLPYELEGWSNSEDLRDMDSVELHKEVLAYYEYLRGLLNEGKVDEYLELTKQSKIERTIADYSSIEEMEKVYQDDRTLMLERCPGNMLPIENYKLVLYAQGRLVRLAVLDGGLRNKSVLLSKVPNGPKTTWRALLHKPKGSKTFKIIR